jgi:Zn-dependent protease with chaperone function
VAAYEVRKDHIEPLWDRVDRNRVRLLVFVALFFVATTLFIGVFLSLALVVAWAIAYGVEVLEFGVLPSGRSAWAQLYAAGVGVLGYTAWALSRNERWFARRLGAVLSPTGELLPTKMALKDMAIASGYDVAPALYVIETANVNAFVFGHGSRRPIVGVTRGLTERLTPDEQRAVFANLMTRLKQGDSLWSSGVTALMAPLWHIRKHQIIADENPLMAPENRQEREAMVAMAQSRVSTPLLFAFGIATIFTFVAEFVVFGHRMSQLRHAEVTDAEGMLLLKDPRSMLSALEKSVRFNNYVPTAGPGMTQLFYCWTGEDSTDDEEDPENRRVVRLREVLGVEGLAPPEVKPNRPVLLVAPAAPRIDEAGESSGREV